MKFAPDQKLRILIATQVFPPEGHPTAVMMADLAGYLVQRGHEVTVAAGFPHHPNGRLPDGYHRRLLALEWVGRVRVRRCWHFISEDRSVPVRAAILGSQAVAMMVAGALERKVDVVLSVGPPIVGPLLSALLARRYRAALVSVVYDLYPDIVIEARKLTNPSLIRIARSLETLMYANSDSLIVLSPGFKKALLARGVPEQKLAVVPVWLDMDEIQPMARDNAWRREQQIPVDKFVVLYAGTIGAVSGAEVVVRAAETLRDNPRILFLFVGEGSVREELVAMAASRGLSNVTFLPFQPRSRLAELQATADVSLVTLLPGRGRTSVPSKVLAYMAAGRPVIASVDLGCDTAELVVRSNAGVVVPPGDADALAQAISMFANDEQRRRALGVAARRNVERTFARDIVLAQFERAIHSALAGP